MGYVVLAGLFEPGTQVRLFAIEDGTLRVGGGEVELGHRLTDSNGSVGFDGVVPGVRCIARGVQFGLPQEVRCLSLAAGEAHEIAQPPITDVPQKQGTQEAPLPDQSAAEAGDVILQTGIPAGLPFGAIST